MNSTPTEYEEQVALVHWLELHNLKFTAIPNSTYTKSIKQKVMNTRMGLRPGLPDLLIIVNGHLVFIELKRTKGSATSPAQLSWIAALNEVSNVQAFVAKGADQAIEIIQQYLPKAKPISELTPMF